MAIAAETYNGRWRKSFIVIEKINSVFQYSSELYLNGEYVMKNTVSGSCS